MVERTLLIEMFKHKVVVKEEAAIEVRNKFGIAQFTKTYVRSEIEIILAPLTVFKLIEDDFDYKEAKINESLARDL